MFVLLTERGRVDVVFASANALFGVYLCTCVGQGPTYAPLWLLKVFIAFWMVCHTMWPNQNPDPN